MQLLSVNGIVPYFNYYLSHGVNIPTIKGLTLNNPQIGYGEGYIAITTDVTYAPTALAQEEEAEPAIPSIPITIN